MIVVLMGVSGSGKTTIGLQISRLTGALFVDADEYHSAANKAKMAAGRALTDEDRVPWLEALHGLLQGWAAKGTSGVLACSALKEQYRETLGAGVAGVEFVLLDGSKELIAERLMRREGHYAKADLLDSQLRTLERPKDAFAVVNDRAPEVVAAEVLQLVGWQG